MTVYPGVGHLGKSQHVLEDCEAPEWAGWDIQVG